MLGDLFRRWRATLRAAMAHGVGSDRGQVGLDEMILLVVGAVVLGAAIVVTLLMITVSGAFADAQPTENFFVENESITQDVPGSTSVSVAGEPTTRGFADDETVRNSSDVILNEGTDYEWHTNNGTVQWFSTANTTDAASATITYNYTAPSEAAQGIIGAGITSYEVFGQSLLIIPVIVVVTLLLGGLVGALMLGGMPGVANDGLRRR